MATYQNKDNIKAKRKSGPKRTYDAKIIMQELIEWAALENSISFCAFCVERGYLPGLIWRLQQEDEEFEDTYQLVKMRLAERRERHLNAATLNYGSWHRYQKGYDPFLSKDEDEELDKAADRRKGVANSQQENLVALAQLMKEGKISQKD